VEVAPAHRRHGLATAIVAELLDWGASLGATTAWLHVEVDNAPGLALYEGLGFRGHHSCRYLTM
jgi:ribosomal protein S18 acetylase RimI-like enzyme